MYWLIIIIIAYFFFSLAALGDKIVLDGPSKPISYTFYVAASGVFALLLIPFTNFGLPPIEAIVWIIAEALAFIFGIYTVYIAVEKFDISKVVTTVGAIQPLFVFLLTYFFWDSVITNSNIIAFILLLAGSILISFELRGKRSFEYVKLTVLGSFFFSLDYIFSKMVFLNEPFMNGFIHTRIVIFAIALLLLISRKNRKEIFNKKNVKNERTDLIFLGGQMSGGVANFLQYLAISLAPVAFLPILNSLRGVQYVFIFLITIFVSIVFPKILKEKMSWPILIQKIISIIIIGAGLAFLVL